MATEFLRRILRDRESLRDYRAGQVPPVEDIRRRVFVAERQTRTGWPDHVHQNLLRLRVQNPQSLRQLLLDVFGAYQRRFLVERGGRLHIHLDHFGEWQDEVSNLSPLCFIAFAIQRAFPPPPADDQGALMQYALERLAPFRHSLLLTPICMEVEDIVAREGLYETHLHLNGSTEIDKIWQDALQRPRELVMEMYRAVQRTDNPPVEREMLRELYEQVEPGLTPAEIASRLRLARRLRIGMCGRLFKCHGIDLPNDIGALTGSDEPLAHMERMVHADHPLRAILPLKNARVLEYELLLMVLVLHRLDVEQDEQLAEALHCYLLILNATFVPLAVQQTEQKGFDQFQKFTFNNIRALSERMMKKTYADRFHQLCNADKAEMALVEGRFAPADTPAGLRKQLRAILSGFGQYQKEIAEISDRPRTPRTRVTLVEKSPQELDWAPRPDLRLIAHFIKKDELSNPRLSEGRCRFSNLRADIARRWRALRHVRRCHALARHFLTGLDAAANELHTPPEVFAPLFRAGRRAGIIHFTYHAGEDFAHLIGGIRAVYEAMEFLDLQSGNRIGHATAIGIDVALWLERTPARFVLQRGELLDDLVFLRQMMLADPLLADVQLRLDERIQTLARMIYGRTINPQLLWSAWRMRRLDARFIHLAHDPICPLSVTDDIDEWMLLRSAAEADPQAFALFEDYHRPHIVAASRALEEWPVEREKDILRADVLTALQRVVLSEVVRRRVVLETLPTSNVRISFYNGHHEHHVFRWLDQSDCEARPIVTIGSDDPGIFACSLKGEYVHLLQAARRRNMDERAAFDMLSEINRNGRLYSFK